jgi:hypothetical protein
MKKLPKMEDSELLTTLRNAEKRGFYRFVDHAQIRLTQREVTVAEVRQIMRKGFHEKKKDEWKEAHREWNYAFRGKTIDGRAIRIAVVVKAPNLLIITVIDLSKKDDY